MVGNIFLLFSCLSSFIMFSFQILWPLSVFWLWCHAFKKSLSLLSLELKTICPYFLAYVCFVLYLNHQLHLDILFCEVGIQIFYTNSISKSSITTPCFINSSFPLSFEMPPLSYLIPTDVHGFVLDSSLAVSKLIFLIKKIF